MDLGKKRISFGLLGILALLILLAFLVASHNNALFGLQGDSIQIGAVLPLTGDSSFYGQQNRRGMDLAIEEINSNGGINGKILSVLYEDSESVTASAVTSFQKLINYDKVSIVFASGTSPETLAMAPVAEQEKVVLLAAGSAAPKIRFAGDYIFRLKTSSDVEAQELSKLIYNYLGMDTLSIFYVRNEYGEAVKDAAQKEFLLLGGKVLEIETFEVGDQDFRTQLAKIKSSGAKAVLLAGWTKKLGPIIKQAKELDLNTQYFAPAGAIDPSIPEIAEFAADGLIYDTEFDISSSLIETIDFVKKYREKFNGDPELFSAFGYDGIKLVAIALEKCGNDSTCIKDSLYKTQNYVGVSGNISFDEYGDVVKPIQFMTIKDGKFVKYED